jgi:hypothetical protein
MKAVLPPTIESDRDRRACQDDEVGFFVADTVCFSLEGGAEFEKPAVRRRGSPVTPSGAYLLNTA